MIFNISYSVVSIHVNGALAAAITKVHVSDTTMQNRIAGVDYPKISIDLETISAIKWCDEIMETTK